MLHSSCSSWTLRNTDCLMHSLCDAARRGPSRMGGPVPRSPASRLGCRAATPSASPAWPRKVQSVIAVHVSASALAGCVAACRAHVLGPDADLAVPPACRVVCVHLCHHPQNARRWLSSNRTCPVCREPADRDRRRPDDDNNEDGDGPPQGPSRRPPPAEPCGAQSQSQARQQQRHRGLDDAMWQAELVYRLHGMHRCGCSVKLLPFGWAMYQHATLANDPARAYAQ